MPLGGGFETRLRALLNRLGEPRQNRHMRTERCRRRQLPLVLDDRLENRIAGLGMPALVVRGTRDPIVSSAWARLLAERAQGEVVEVPGPHVVMYTAPERVAAAILRRVGGPA
jgi:pimeloyl-ACP methyl ester carboxylesterase